MTTRLARWSPWCVLVVMTLAAPALAANARLNRVLLLPSIDRSSIVFELTAEPRHVSTRRISDSVVEVEAGGVETVAPKLLKAPANVRYVDSVTIREFVTEAGPVVRARIALSSAAHVVARSAGQRVYVDVSAMQGPAPAPARPASASRAAAAVPAAVATPPVSTTTAFSTAVRPSLDKLKEMAPFLASAAASGDPKVAAALLPGVLAVRTNLAAQQPPDAARGSHVAVVNAVDRILRALSPEFTGDRPAAVAQAVTTIEVVGAVLRE